MDFDALADRLIIPSFSAPGYRVRARDFDPIPRLDGKAVLVTGPTSGIGRAAAQGFHDLGAELVLVGRSAEKLGRVNTELGGGHRTIVADLSRLADGDRMVDEVDASELDVVVHNAGAMFDEHARTADGIERTLALNLVVPFRVTEGLLDRGLEPDAKVVFVSSGGMYGAAPSLKDQRTDDDYRPALAYARAKRGQVMAVEAWASDRPEGPWFAAMHPGWVDTPGVSGSLPMFRKLTGPFLRTAEEGADTILWLASTEGLPSGGFWHDRRQRPAHYLKSTEVPTDRQSKFLERVRRLAATTPV